MNLSLTVVMFFLFFVCHQKVRGAAPLTKVTMTSGSAFLARIASEIFLTGL
jgi:hypothetical protein